MVNLQKDATQAKLKIDGLQLFKQKMLVDEMGNSLWRLNDNELFKKDAATINDYKQQVIKSLIETEPDWWLKEDVVKNLK